MAPIRPQTSHSRTPPRLALHSTQKGPCVGVPVEAKHLYIIASPPRSLGMDSTPPGAGDRKGGAGHQTGARGQREAPASPAPHPCCLLTSPPLRFLLLARSSPSLFHFHGPFTRSPSSQFLPSLPLSSSCWAAESGEPRDRAQFTLGKHPGQNIPQQQVSMVLGHRQMRSRERFLASDLKALSPVTPSVMDP